MTRTERRELAEHLAAMQRRFLPGEAASSEKEGEPSPVVDVEAVLKHLQALSAAPRKRALRHTLLTAPERFSSLA